MGKSSLISKAFPAWYLGRHPDHRVMIGSEEQTLASEFSGDIRKILKTWGPVVFGVTPATPQQNRARQADWRIAHHAGGCRAAGIETGGFTGRGANLLIIDDPIKNPEGALSPVYRERVWNWYLSTARSRLEPDGIIIVTATRWHMDDLIGRLIKHEEGLWERVTLPALAVAPSEMNGWAEDPLGRAVGEALWPDRVPASDLEDIRKASPYWWEAMFQQRPTPEGGQIAQGVWFKVLRAGPKKPVNAVRFWDCAATDDTKSDPDYTVGAKVSEDEFGQFIIEHIVRVRASSGNVDRIIRQTAESDGREVLIREEQEPGASGKAVIAARLRALAGFNYQGVPSRGAKVLRWAPMLNQAEAGNFYIVDGPWVQPWIDEVNQAPFGTHDDQLDAVSSAFICVAGERRSAVPGVTW